MEGVLKDLRNGIRMLLRYPGFTIVAAVILGLTIAANTAIFSAVDAVLLRPLPFRDPDRLVMLWPNNPKIHNTLEEMPASAANFVDWRRQNSVFQFVVALQPQPMNLTDNGLGDRVGVVRVSAEFFDCLGKTPSLGRAFLKEEDRPGANPVAIISDGLWKRRFGADPAILGKTIRLDAITHTVIGVMPPGINFPLNTDLPSFAVTTPLPARSDLWVPLALTPEQVSQRAVFNLLVLARLKPEVGFRQAENEMTLLASRLEKENPMNRGWSVKQVSLPKQAVGKIRNPLLILLAAVGFLFLIGCANIANMLMARAIARQKEIAIRVSLGASCLHLFRQFFAESLVLGLVGGLLGIFLGWASLRLLLALSPSTLLQLQGISINPLVLAFSLLISIGAGFIFGLAPALYALRSNLELALKEGGRGSSQGFHRNRMQHLFIIFEVSLAVVLLVAAMLTVRSFQKLQRIDLGFDPNGILAVQIHIPERKYSDRRRQTALIEQILERVKAVSGVTAAATVQPLALAGTDYISTLRIRGVPPPAPENPLSVVRRTISRDYFQAMGISLVRGRAFTEMDQSNSVNVCLINETMALRFWPNQNPIGKQIASFFDEKKLTPVWAEIIGVVKDVKQGALTGDIHPEVYVPYKQFPVNLYPALVLRSAADPRIITDALRQINLAVDSEVVISTPQTMKQLAHQALAPERFSMILLGAFALMAVLIASVGLYGLVSYSVNQRKHEFGLRLALGAQHSHVMRLVLGEGLRLGLCGIAVGLLMAFGMSRLMSSLLYGVSAKDPLTFSLVPWFVLALTVLACYLPARRAAQASPLVTLRGE